MEVTLKAFLPRGGSTEARRIPLSLTDPNGRDIFKQALVKVSQSFPDLKDKCFSLMWKDADGDDIVMSTDEEMLEALSHTAGSPLKVYILVEGDREKVLGGTEEDHPRRANHEREDEWPFMFPNGGCEIPFENMNVPPFSSCDRDAYFQEMNGGKKRRHHGHHGRMHGHGPFGGHRPFGGHGGYGPFGGLGPFGGQGPLGGGVGPFGGHAPFGGTGGHCSFAGRGGHGHFGGHGGPGSFAGHHQAFLFGNVPEGFHPKCKEGKKAEKKLKKAYLRDSIPILHRRWAKGYIRDWRVMHLTNATTSSESDEERLTLTSASVPEAYAKWLNQLLPKWHRRWGQYKNSIESDSDKSDSEADSSEDAIKLNASVPKEFRKWVRWYLVRRFSQREAPKFHQEDFPHFPGYGKMCKKFGKKAWKKACKMNTLNGSVPLKYRVWARAFVRQWRLENKLSHAPGASSSESEDTEKDIVQGEITVPNEYVKWMQKFLVKWHAKRCVLEGKQTEIEGMAELKDSVPWDFRKWVKCYMCHRYASPCMFGQMDTASQYQKWFAAFQKKWLSEQSKDSSSEDNGSSARKPAEKEVETSFKRLRLEENGNHKKNVSFDAEANESEKKSDKAETCERDCRKSFHHKKMNPGLHHWMKEALYQWDGKTPSNTSEQANPDQDIPPHMYHWMTKLMLKMQMKKMKEEMKGARKEMKAAWKAHKFNM